MAARRSRIHPKYKTKYRVTNWPQYDQALAQRGSLTLWLSTDAIRQWEPQSQGKRGGQLRYANIAIETALSLRLIFHLPLRQTEGFLRSVFKLMTLDLDAPDHTTLSRRNRTLLVSLPKKAADVDKAREVKIAFERQIQIGNDVVAVQKILPGPGLAVCP